MNNSEFIQYCKDKYIGKVVVLKHAMYLYNKRGGMTWCLNGYIDVIKGVCITDSNSSIKFCFEEMFVILPINRFKELNRFYGYRFVSDVFKIIDN